MKKSALLSRPLTSSDKDAVRIPQEFSRDEANNRTLQRSFENADSKTPSRFRRSPRRQTGRANRQLKESTKLSRLFKKLRIQNCAYLFTFAITELDASLSDDPKGRFDHRFVDRCFNAAQRLFRGSFYMVLEVSRSGRLHVHIIAHRDDGPKKLVRGSERCKLIYNPHGLIKYLNKADPSDQGDINEYLAVRILSEHSRPPRLRRTFDDARRRDVLDSMHIAPISTGRIKRRPLSKQDAVEYTGEQQLAQPDLTQSEQV